MGRLGPRTRATSATVRPDAIEAGTLSYLGLSYPCVLANTSAGGVLIMSSVAPPIGAEVRVEFPEMGRYLGNVVHATSGSIDIEFKKELAGN